jgi:hypothetical protein
VNDFVIILVGPENFGTDAIRMAWQAAGIELLGPLPLHKLDAESLERALGVVMDISLDADALFEFSEFLEQRQLPHLYAVREDQVQRRDGAYIVSSAKADIEAIVEALTSEGDIGIRH